jgi:hypothetical protein
VLTRISLRDSLAVKNERLGEVLKSLEWAGQPHTQRLATLLWTDEGRSVPFPIMRRGMEQSSPSDR